MLVQGKLTFLGTGSSLGIPVVGCKCKVCLSEDRRNKRLRPGALIEVEQRKILIDASQDIRQQALNNQIDYIDGLIFTHAHYDHTAGIDDLRVYRFKDKKKLKLLLSKETYQDLAPRYSYIFQDINHEGQLVSKFDLHFLEKDRGQTHFLGLKLSYFSYQQANMPVNGFRFGSLAYVTDIKKYPETIFEDLKGVDTLVISALRFTCSKLHLSVDEAIAFANRCQAKKTYFIHIAHELDHVKTNAYLPKNMQLAYDGLKIFFTAEMDR